MNLSGSVALVTGGARGIGAATAALLAARGAEVHVLDTLAVDEAPPGVAMHACDIADEEMVREAVQRIAAARGLHILVNNAGINPSPASLTETGADSWDRVIDTNLRGLYLVSHAAIPRMQAGGSVVNVASILALQGVRACAAYTAAKGAIVALSRAMARDHAPRIRVNCICPGAVETDMFEEYLRRTGQPEVERQRIAAAIPLQRFGRPEDIAAAVAFLCSAEAAWITGTTLVVDGGDSA